MQGVLLVPHVRISGEILTINIDGLVESAGSTPLHLVTELLTKTLLDYPSEISYLAVGNFTWSTRFSRQLLTSILNIMACRSRRPIILRLGITDQSFESYMNLQRLVELHRYIKHWTLTFNINEIPRLSSEILKPFHHAPWASRLTIMSNSLRREANDAAQDNFKLSLENLADSKSSLHFELVIDDTEITY